MVKITLVNGGSDAGGCVLFEKREQVEQFLAESAEKKRGSGHAS